GGWRRRLHRVTRVRLDPQTPPGYVECKIELAEYLGAEIACEIARPGVGLCLEFSEHIRDSVIAQSQRFQARDFAVHLAQQSYARDQAQPLRVTLTQLVLLNKPGSQDERPACSGIHHEFRRDAIHLSLDGHKETFALQVK